MWQNRRYNCKKVNIPKKNITLYLIIIVSGLVSVLLIVGAFILVNEAARFSNSGKNEPVYINEKTNTSSISDTVTESLINSTSKSNSRQSDEVQSIDCDNCIVKDNPKAKIASNLLDKLISKYSIFSTGYLGKYYAYIYQDISVLNMDNEFKLLLGIGQYRDKINSLLPEEYSGIQLKLSENQMHESMVDLFGANVNYNDASTTGFICQYPLLRFDGGNVYNIFITNQCGGIGYRSLAYKISSYEQIDSYLYVYVKPIFFSGAESDVMYTDPGYEHIISGSSGSCRSWSTTTGRDECSERAISTYYDNLDTYKFTFIADSDDYYLSSVEKVK